MRLVYLFTLVALLMSCDPSSPSSLKEAILRNDFLSEIISLPAHEVQVVYTEIQRDSANNPIFKRFPIRLDSNTYFYPASTVKMPVALLALEKLNELNIAGLDRNTAMLTDSAFSGQSKVYTDSTSKSGLPSIAHYIKKLFVVSDNDAYNRLYEFLGQDYINQKLHKKGYTDTRIIHRLSLPLSPEENRANNPIRFIKDDTVIYQQPLTHDKGETIPKKKIQKGKGYTDQEGNLINEPFDFTEKNFFPLSEQHRMLKAIIFPDQVEPSSRFNLSVSDYQFVLDCMSRLPRQTVYPYYNEAEYYDAYVKFLLFGNNKERIPEHIKIYNKIGQAYGYMTDNAYIKDEKNGIEFLLSATIHVNKNEIYNDGIYEYDSLGYRFMEELGRLVYEYNLR